MKLTPEESREIALRPIADAAAYECYSRPPAASPRRSRSWPRSSAQPDDKVTWFARAAGWALRGEGEALAASVTPERLAWASADPHYTLSLAECFALAGRHDDAFDWLERMMRTGAAPYRFIAEKDPLLARLRGHSRWPALMARLKQASEQVDFTGDA